METCKKDYRFPQTQTISPFKSCQKCFQSFSDAMRCDDVVHAEWQLKTNILKILFSSLSIFNGSLKDWIVILMIRWKPLNGLRNRKSCSGIRSGNNRLEGRERRKGMGGKLLTSTKEREIVNFLCIKIAGWKKYNYSTAMASNGDGRSCK